METRTIHSTQADEKCAKASAPANHGRELLPVFLAVSQKSRRRFSNHPIEQRRFPTFASVTLSTSQDYKVFRTLDTRQYSDGANQRGKICLRKVY